MTNKFICIHGHFYQPPRENPWLEEVEMQDTAFPYHDWNERISAECYAPNAASRILDNDGRIIHIVNNYKKISFDFGPTLLSWLEKHEPEVYKSVLDADKEGQKRFSGHGPALAQCYNHMIMPLANARDKRTQILWGIKDFEYRFKRKPEGMWLPETAVDLESLDIMAENGITFTVLAPRQAGRIQKIGSGKWDDVTEETIDSRRPYTCKLPSGKSIAIFFYEGPIAQDIAFGNLLDKGEDFAKRMMSPFQEDSKSPQLAHVAIDGETFGHHHRHGDMALAYCLYYLEKNNLAKITIYGEYLEHNKPEYEVEIIGDSSWSCEHGVERWRNDCGCNSGKHSSWNQKWRAPLRGAMDWLSDTLNQLYDDAMGKLVSDPWKIRDEYIDIILDRSPNKIDQFLARFERVEISKEKKIRALNLLEMERHLMLMYTSCGWFADETSGIETVQVMQYASRAMQLAREIGDLSLEDAYINLLERVPSNISEFKTGAKIYEMFIKPYVVDFLRLGAHYAISSLFTKYPSVSKIYCFTAEAEVCDKSEVGKQKIAVGKVKMRSEINLEEALISFAVLHLGDHNIIGGVRMFRGDESFNEMHREIRDAFSRSDISDVMRLIDKHFGSHSYSLWHLFKDEQSKILKQIFSAALFDMEASFRNIKENHYPVMQTMRELRIPFPKVFTSIVEYILNADIHRLLEKEKFDTNMLGRLVEEAKRWGVKINKEELSFIVSQKVNMLIHELVSSPHDLSLLEQLQSTLSFLDFFPLDLNLWKSQNRLFSIARKYYNEMRLQDEEGDLNAKEWLEYFNTIGKYMRVKTI
ncbi:MAG: DUF3536 domain-containing protein [Candidatus Ancaeobacter aquaticus]|nr:DUF3536 domain-containing protein [Candidatus Ancaeobacter aquaticus]